MMFGVTINDFITASELLTDEGKRRRGARDGKACERVAEYLRFVAEQREEFEARKRAEERPQRQRFPTLKTGMQAVWRVKASAAAELAEG